MPICGRSSVVRAPKLADRTGIDETAIWEWGFLERVSSGLYVMSLGAVGRDHAGVWGLVAGDGVRQGVALLLTLATYATGFLTKPVGAYIFGAYGDRVGRRDSLYLSILLMAVSSLIVTVVPGYSRIGFAAPILLVVARLLEGISSGGEFGLSAAYLIEFAPPGGGRSSAASSRSP